MNKISTEENLEDQLNTDLLSKEYEWCQDAKQKLETTIWQTSATIGTGLIGVFALTAGRDVSQETACIIGAFTFAVSIIWWFMARRWWSIQQANIIRMQHIESKLGIYRERYVDYLDNPNHLSKSGLPPEQVTELRNRAKEKQYVLLPVHQRGGIQELLLLFFVLNALAWVLYILLNYSPNP